MRSQAVTPGPQAVTFDDEFNGRPGAGPNSGVAAGTWRLDPCWTTGCGTSPTEYLSSNAYLNGHGALVLQANRGARGECGNTPCLYTSAGLTMTDWADGGTPSWKQQYGTISARILMPSGSGLWPAFWMKSSDVALVHHPEDGEIDIVEGNGDDTRIFSQHALGGVPPEGLPQLNYGGLGAYANSGRATAWHTYSVTWSPYGILWEVNGQVTRTMSPAQAGPAWELSFQRPFTMRLDLEVGGKSVGDPGRATHFPAEMLVDYVRATR